MALRAGYFGVKRKLIDDINTMITKFTDALVIKSIGSGLTLDSSGELSADNDNAGVIYDITGTKTKVGTYTDSLGSKDLYQVTIVDDSLSSGWNSIDITGLNIDKVVDAKGIFHTASNGDWIVPYNRQSSNLGVINYSTADGLRVYLGTDYSSTGSIEITVVFTETAAEAKTTRSKKSKKTEEE